MYPLVEFNPGNQMEVFINFTSTLLVYTLNSKYGALQGLNK